MKPEPTIPEKIEEITDEGELDGFAGQLRADGRMDARLENLIAMRKQEIRTMRGWPK